MPGSDTPSVTPEMMQPACSKCGRPMRLARVEPGEPGRDLRVFECRCGHTETRDVAL